jgi:hypothetical protein
MAAVVIGATALLAMRLMRTSDVRLLTGPQSAAPRLRGHVQMLAGTIGERNLWRHDALTRAADYITAQLAADSDEKGSQQYRQTRAHDSGTRDSRLAPRVNSCLAPRVDSCGFRLQAEERGPLTAVGGIALALT